MIFVVLTLWIPFHIACTQTAVYLSSTQTEDWRFTLRKGWNQEGKAQTTEVGTEHLNENED